MFQINCVISLVGKRDYFYNIDPYITIYEYKGTIKNEKVLVQLMKTLKKRYKRNIKITIQKL